MRLLGLTITLVLAAPAAAQEAGTSPAPKAAAGSKAAEADAKPEGKKEFKLENFDLFERRNPFSPTPERRPKKPVVKPTKKPDPKPVKKRDTRDEITKNLTLTSVMIPKDGSKRPVAIVEEADTEPRHLQEGDAFLKGRVTAVSLDGITVLIGEKPRIISLGEEFADGTKTHKVYVDTGEPVDGPSKSSSSGSSSSSSDSGKKKSGGVSSLLSDEEKKLPPAERLKLLRKRMKERSKTERGK